jgi:Nucleotidyltransferase substrate binding protein like
MRLDVTPLRKAIGQLRQRLKRHLAEPTDKQPRDGRVRRFEFTCGLSHKLPRRYLQEIVPTAEDARRMTVAEFARAGNDLCSLRGEWPVWRHFRDICTRTAHAYDPDSPSEVLGEIPSFLGDPGFLCGVPEKRIG